MKRVLIAGGGGQLASALVPVFQKSGWEVMEKNRHEMDISKGSDVHAVIESFRPDCFINTAAYNQVEKAESESAECHRINSTAPGLLAKECKARGIPFVHYSTDFVFDGTAGRPYEETDAPHPLSIYGKSKWEGEQAVVKAGGKYLILRTSGLYGKAADGRGKPSFVTRLQQQSKEGRPVCVVNDITTNPTCTLDLAAATLKLVENGALGLFHAGAQGFCTWHEFAVVAFKILKIETPITAVSSTHFPSKVVRPKFSALKNGKMEKLGLNTFPTWEEGLRHFLVG